jgi:hypothetical protein
MGALTLTKPVSGAVTRVREASVGRPTIRTHEVEGEILGRLAIGQSMRSICTEDGMPALTTVFRWLAEDQVFAAAYAAARDAQAETLADELVELADSARGEPAEVVSAVKLAVDTRKWVASKLKPKKYGDKLDVDHAGELVVRIVD